MSIFFTLSKVALRQLVDGACAVVGVKQSGDAVVGFLTERFSDHSQRLSKALKSANENAWKALEIALAGDSFWERCKGFLARTEDKAFAEQVRAFLDAAPLPELSEKDQFRQKCLEELRTARKDQSLSSGTIDARQLAQGAADFARFSDPKSRLDAEWEMVLGMAAELKEAGFSSLAWLLSQRPEREMPLLVLGARYFFRRAVENDQKLFQGLSFAKLEALSEAQEEGFAALSCILVSQAERMEELLGGVQAVVVETHSAVLDLQGQMKGQSEQIQEMGLAVQKLLEQHQLHHRELRPSDSFSIRNDSERQLVKQLVSRYRALPEEQRRQAPALLNALGKLQVVAGDFEAAQRDFAEVATLAAHTSEKAEAHFNAYRTALERRDWGTALRELLHAVKLDGKRYAPFPVSKYHPNRILGAGGFGVAFACRHKQLNAEVVVKTLTGDDLGRNVDEVFTEARVLYQLEHPAIIRLLDCGYTRPADKARPYLVMNLFEGVTLEEFVQKHGALSPDDLMPVARQMAEGLQAAHCKGILHRDVKPANLLVRKDGTGWQVKLIDFGLALKQSVIQKGIGTSKPERTITDSSIAGTLDFAAPEQMGRRHEPTGPYSDVYGFAKTCFYALFQTTQPLLKHWQSLGPKFAALMERCLDEDPRNRPQTFAEVLLECADVNGKAGKLAGNVSEKQTASSPGPAAEADVIAVEEVLEELELQPYRDPPKARRVAQARLDDLETECPRPLGFADWYKINLGSQSIFVQIILWFLYGFIWIPIWFIVSGSKPQLKVFHPGWAVLACFPYLNWAFWIYAGLKAKCSNYYLFASLYAIPFCFFIVMSKQNAGKTDAPDWVIAMIVIAWLAGIVQFLMMRKTIAERIVQHRAI